jgi:hypothetical protein
VQGVQLHPASGGEVVVERGVRVRGESGGEGHLLLDDVVAQWHALPSAELDHLIDDLPEHRPPWCALADVTKGKPHRRGQARGGADERFPTFVDGRKHEANGAQILIEHHEMAQYEVVLINAPGGKRRNDP